MDCGTHEAGVVVTEESVACPLAFGSRLSIAPLRDFHLVTLEKPPFISSHRSYSIGHRRD